MAEKMLETNLNLKLFKKGKVRDIYDLGDKLLIVATDRISAFDVVFPNEIPQKGKVLTQLSVFWFQKLRKIIDNHLLTADFNQFPVEIKKYPEIKGQSMLVKKAKPILIECIVRGYLTGSAWKNYQAGKKISGIKLPSGLKEAEKLAKPIFTPTSKAKVGHDVELTEKELSDLVGKKMAKFLKEKSLSLYQAAIKETEPKGILVADTKFEFGLLDKTPILIDEILTPDSSRFWLKKDYQPGKTPKSFDKQFVRDFLETLSWDKNPPPPCLPENIVLQTSQRYLEIYQRITGKPLTEN